MPFESDSVAAIEPFMVEGWVTDILFEVKSGKEATVFCCRGGPRAPVPLLAAKVYRPIESRSFRNDDRYVGGRLHMARDGRARRAVRSRSTFGRQVQYGTWLAQEWAVLRQLYGTGVPVPRPLALQECAILLPFLGDETGPAPMLHEVKVDRTTAVRITDDLLDAIALMLDCDCVHGDLSPYNVMLVDGAPIIIDFPQAIDPRLNRHGADLLARDVENVCRWAARQGVRRPADRITSRLWTRFVLGELG